MYSYTLSRALFPDPSKSWMDPAPFLLIFFSSASLSISHAHILFPFFLLLSPLCLGLCLCPFSLYFHIPTVLITVILQHLFHFFASCPRDVQTSKIDISFSFIFICFASQLSFFFLFPIIPFSRASSDIDTHLFRAPSENLWKPIHARAVFGGQVGVPLEYFVFKQNNKSVWIRKREGDTDRQTDRQTDKQTNRHKNSLTVFIKSHSPSPPQGRRPSPCCSTKNCRRKIRVELHSFVFSASRAARLAHSLCCGCIARRKVVCESR